MDSGFSDMGSYQYRSMVAEISTLRAQLSECRKAALLEAADVVSKHYIRLDAEHELRRMAEGE